MKHAFVGVVKYSVCSKQEQELVDTCIAGCPFSSGYTSLLLAASL